MLLMLLYEWYMDTASGEIYLVMLEDELDPNLNNFFNRSNFSMGI